ncbi:hypothetical protein AM500_04085 [Bacillus sp. FJAT-18017]|uniref:DUF2975 domain-containing protein n=1 Tax=Bacillus sp. FJAT-18017 TaxID=1705566 RepID=UPI0006AFCCA4|nr:DUF2975 domain-containing protein [Bacillus sp. FJAT-18017]ALC89061.1 hypothetical protein AM500_04085 [Bacillus sp. FJAT-18017]
MKRGSTLFLRLALFLIGTPVLACGSFGLYWLMRNPANPEYAHILYPIVIGMYVSAIPFFTALYQALKLLGFIDKNQAFSDLSVNALRKIKISAMVFSGVYVVILPFVFMVAELDDAPGLVIVGMVPVFAGLVIAVFAAVLQRLLKEAIDIKSENDLTV